MEGKYKVKKTFKSKKTGEIISAGSIIEIKEERAEEILKVGDFIEKIDEVKEKTEQRKRGGKTR